MIDHNDLSRGPHPDKPGTTPSQHPTGASPLTTRGNDDLRSLIIVHPRLSTFSPIQAQFERNFQFEGCDTLQLEKCDQCYNLFRDPIEGWVCDQTMQPVFMMHACPMEDNRVRTDLDPCYVWFPSTGYALAHCRNAAYGRPCQFMCNHVCDITRTDIRYMAYCPLPRLDPETLKTLKPKANYDILRIR